MICVAHGENKTVLPALVVFLILLLIGFSGLDHGLCQEAPNTEETRTDGGAPATEPEINIGAWLATFFSRHISAVDGDRCPSAPTCSSYSAQAFRKHGFFVGWVMTVDRLIHEGDEGSVSPLVRRGKQLKILDPVENNDFWWYSKNEKHGD
ncbi:MAG: membrane protein insertion efficiency factor YidD [Deltaproteobacteria bacterium]|nr:membrane protein insertion efficiency factor YidD [Deltaproteobacteria bacterium]